MITYNCKFTCKQIQ